MTRTVALTLIALVGCSSGRAGVEAERTSAPPSGSATGAPPASAASPSGAPSVPGRPSDAPPSKPSDDRCVRDDDCVLLTEDSCCVPSNCDEDRRALTKAAVEQKHRACTLMDCVSDKRRPCSAKDVRVIAACRDGACTLVRP